MTSDAFHLSAPSPQEEGLALPNPQFRTLVVDGNFFFTGFLEKFLESEGHSILTAATIKDALAKTRQFQPDLILLDSELDGATGLSLLSELLMEQSSASVIMLARQPSIAEAVEAIKLGATDYFERPLDPQRLRHAIESQKTLFKAQRALETRAI
jgi:two-component system phosphoglycerate transport system response regulator PgtA